MPAGLGLRLFAARISDRTQNASLVGSQTLPARL
jgi:hypothetical protein